MATALPAACIRARERWSSCRAARDELRQGATLDEIVKHYVRYDRPESKAEVDYYSALPSVAEAMRRAGRAERPDGKRHPHQTRITRTALGRAGELLARLRVHGCKSFEELHSLFEETIGVIPGVGPLFVYDTTLRVGARLGLAPRHVFLHAGVRKGAVALGLGRGRDYLDASELPPAFRRLEPREIEDCLCIYKDHLVAAVSARVTAE